MNTPDSSNAFLRRLRQGLDQGSFEIDDTLTLLLPLFRQIAEAHDNGLVAPLRGTAALLVTEADTLAVAPDAFVVPQRNETRINQVLGPGLHAVEVVGESNRVTDIDDGLQESARLDVSSATETVTKPVFLLGYQSWEHAVGHHDPVTDIFSLGQFLASLACGLDFNDREDLELFARHRDNLFDLNSRLHPVIARVIVQMTELNRRKRAQDLGQMLRILENYRDQPLDLDISAIKAGATADRRRLIQENLRDRLFEISRRNRLIHFKPSLQMINLTVASVPLVMNVSSIRLEQLFVWHPELASMLIEGKPVSLGKYLRLEDAPYIPGVLDKIIAESRRDRAEYGFAQLSLVLCFLRWHNLKETPEERIHSPLLLLPVELVKRKGVRDAYVLTPTTSEAEVNPALRHHLKTLYGVMLPESIDLQKTSLDAFHQSLQNQIYASEPGVTLEKIDRPKIELIHARARQRLDQWKKRQRTRSTRAKAAEVSHSYDRENYLPRGLQLFMEKVKPRPCPLSEIVGAPPRPRLPGLAPAADGDSPPDVATAPETADSPSSTPVIEKTSEHYALRDGEGANPYHWTFDLCSLTLGNFHYRKMTLVRDYAKLGEDDPANPAFDSVFSLEPKPNDDTAREPLPLREQFPVIPCDAAQAAAVARSRDGLSFIIQGPPGTGKSQTITNLIADYLAQGKRVLFVCEKRAAIDVVFHRLRQQGLDELCCLIHDSQADKKAFIQNLKQTYEQWLSEPPSDDVERTRDQALRSMEHDLAALGRFSEAMTTTTAEAGQSTRWLLHRLIETSEHLPPLTSQQEDLLPVYSFWLSHGSLIERLLQSFSILGLDPVFAQHPLRWLSRELILHPRPLEHLRQQLDEIDPLLDSLESSLELSGLDDELWETLPDIAAIIDFAERVRFLADQGQLALLDPASPLSKQLQQQAVAFTTAGKALKAAQENTGNWKDRLTPSDTTTALEAARKFEGSFLRILQPSYWRLKKTIRARYDYAKHAVEPSLVRILEDLQTEHTAVKQLGEQTTAFNLEFNHADPAALLALISEARETGQGLPAAAVAFRRLLLKTSDSVGLVASLADLQGDFGRFQAALTRLLDASDTLEFESLRQLLSGLRREMRTLPDLLPLLTELVDAPPTLSYAVRNSDLRLDQFEAAIAFKTLQNIYRTDIALNRFDGRLLEAYRHRIEDNHRAWLKTNAVVIRNQIRRKFRENVNVSSLVAAQLTEEQKLFKKTYAAGRRELEHEFGKSMRYKSIRDLAAGASGEVVRDLKPVWLMSPLSVSDTLPLDPKLFDVVIFDEASQIPVEEAVPAVYRAHQVIVVGDEMQLPPTKFFSGGASSSEDNDDDSLERIEVELEADSFLAQAARNLPSTLLAWHYRSRSENLISFSNAAFYGGNLYTIPDRQLAPASRHALVVASPKEGSANTDALLGRSISYHFLENGVYEQRRNRSEAAYIAQVVRELLLRETKLSIGIVAFSEAQQGEIESALDALADEDKDFATRLEAETNREEDDQFCGLFVKNLENVQGDERDIILLSICYGYDRGKKMLMNFGPINQRGGEKRLNVIFSRARHHMAVVSSIRYQDITNDYNDGAGALRNFLRYAENLSRGDEAGARGVLENLNPLSRRALAPLTERDAVISQLADKLRERGHQVDLNAGQSRFRCDLALRDPNGRAYSLGVLVDTEAHYQNPNLIDRYLTRPSILQAFDWNVLLVLTKDWFHEPDAVLKRVEQAVQGTAADVLALPEIPDEDPVPAPPVNPRSVKPASSPMPANAPTQPTSAGLRRMLKYTEGDSQKFWEIVVTDNAFTVRFGRIGTAGQTQKKQFENETEARKAAEQLVQSKLRKGYQDEA